MSIILAYPHEFAKPVKKNLDVYTVVWETGAGWPREILGPDPQYVSTTSRFLVSLSKALDAKLVLPLTEEAVLACAIANTKTLKRGVHQGSGLVCVDRFRQMEVLGDLGPESVATILGQPFRFPCFVKSRASTRSLGVMECPDNQSFRKIAGRVIRASCIELGRLEKSNLAKGNLNKVILQEKLNPPFYEVNGYCTSQIAGIFNVLKQEWSDRRVDRYSLVSEIVSQNATLLAKEAVTRVGLNWCGWNVELGTHSDGGLKVLEIHARLGEDWGEYNQLLCKEAYGNPIQEMTEGLLEALGS